MLNKLSSWILRAGCACQLWASIPHLQAQQLIWTDTYNGGVVTGTFSIGDHSSGIGVIWMELPAGATVRKALLYVTSVGGTPEAALAFQLGSIPINLGPATAGPSFNTLYGSNVLHTVDITDQLDPALSYHLIDLSGVTTTFKEFMLVTEYELPGMGPITLDIMHLGLDSQLQEDYMLTASHPMSTDSPVAFATMAGYCRDWISDYETVSVNGTVLGNLHSADYNATAGNQYGACATFHYANGIFEGIGDDSIDVAINGPDALSTLNTLIDHGDQSIQVSYAHTPTLDPAQQQDNIVNLALLAYSAAPCDNAADPLGPDTTLCPGDTLLLDATRDGAGYLWHDGSTAATYPVTEPGTYVVQWSHPLCTYDPDTIVVNYVNVPAGVLGADRDFCIGDSLLLEPDLPDGATFSWNDGHSDLSRMITTPGVYALNYAVQGCFAVDSILLTVEDCAYGVEMPNIFTPNGDGVNDVFRPVAFQGVASASFVVYNRWGQEMFHTTRPEAGWNGRNLSGQPVPDGVYFWVLEHVPDQQPGTRVAQSGTVQLLR
ncbi:MAG: gliding motility-associated C-terminal domain-containing protein [Flavobacteriales bacterium]|nr:gliding motility-associated C-terminal domain-containing protein [Flavobacteriales bacterium]